ncbi:hypothetical protein QTP88_008868 [Uroleucon formosanum]
MSRHSVEYVCKRFEVLHGDGETFCRIVQSSAAADILGRRSRTTGFRSCDWGHARAGTKNYILSVFDKNPSIAPPGQRFTRCGGCTYAYSSCSFRVLLLCVISVEVSRRSGTRKTGTVDAQEEGS